MAQPAQLARLLAGAAVILGSNSASRRALLTELGVNRFDVLPAGIDEKAIRRDSAEELARSPPRRRSREGWAPAAAAAGAGEAEVRPPAAVRV